MGKCLQKLLTPYQRVANDSLPLLKQLTRLIWCWHKTRNLTWLLSRKSNSGRFIQIQPSVLHMMSTVTLLAIDGPYVCGCCLTGRSHNRLLVNENPWGIWYLKPGFHLMFQWSRQIGVVCSRERYCVLPVSTDNHRLVYCEVYCIWRYVNCIVHPVFG